MSPLYFCWSVPSFHAWVPLCNLRAETTEQDSSQSPQKSPFPARKSGQCAAGAQLERSEPVLCAAAHALRVPSARGVQGHK